MRVCTYEKCGKETKTLTKGLCPTCYARFQRNGTAEYVRPNRSFGLTQCSFCDSKEGPFIKSLCRACYQRQYKNGTPEMQRVRNLCHVPGCDDPVTAHGLCQRHSMRLRRHGNIDAGRPEGWGQKRKHPLYEAWQSMRRASRRGGGHDQRWDDFWEFLKDVGDRPDIGWRLFRKRQGLPMSKENCEWRPPISDQPQRVSKNAYMREYRIKRPGINSRQSRKQLYGIDHDDDWYECTLAEQGGVCGICRCPETQRHAKTGEIIALAVDHDKKTGQLRGILCKACNTSIGAMKHSIPILRAAIAYLERHAVDTSGEPA